MRERLDAMRIQCKVVEVRNLRTVIQHACALGESVHSHLFEMFDKVWVLVGDVLLHERCSLEEFLTCLTPEFALVLLLDVRLAGSRQLPGKNVSRQSPIRAATYSS